MFGLSRKDLSRRSGISQSLLGILLRGEYGLTHRQALGLEQVFSEPAELWMKAQRRCELEALDNNGQTRQDIASDISKTPLTADSLTALPDLLEGRKHPGLLLKAIRQENKLSVKNFSATIDWHRPTLVEIMREKLYVTTALAIRLEARDLGKATAWLELSDRHKLMRMRAATALAVGKAHKQSMHLRPKT